MVYRSRYLNRLMFSPPSYRERLRQVTPRAETTWGGSGARLGTAEPTPDASATAAPQGDLSERAPYLPTRELRDTLRRCEQAITAGRARPRHPRDRDRVDKPAARCGDKF